MKSYLETAFNDASVSGGKYQLNVEFWVGNEWSDVYYILRRKCKDDKKRAQRFGMEEK